MQAATRGAAVQQLDLRPSTIRAQQPAVLQNVRDMVRCVSSIPVPHGALKMLNKGSQEVRWP